MVFVRRGAILPDHSHGGPLSPSPAPRFDSYLDRHLDSHPEVAAFSVGARGSYLLRNNALPSRRFVPGGARGCVCAKSYTLAFADETPGSGKDWFVYLFSRAGLYELAAILPLSPPHEHFRSVMDGVVLCSPALVCDFEQQQLRAARTLQ